MRVLFTGREHRVRRRETIQNPPKGIEFVTLQSLSDMKNDYDLTNTKTSTKNKISRYLKFIRDNNLIPQKKLKDIDLIYSPGHLVLNKFPFVIEIDNVAALTYYNLEILKLLKPIIKKRLKSKYCKSIICISEAAKKSIINTFKDKEIEKKCVVVYPYSNYPKIKKKKSKKIRFLFISSNFYLKGGKEVVNSFLNLNVKNKNASLTILTKTKDINLELIKKINEDTNIKLVEANLEKGEIFKKYYSTTDVFILPTYQDSFGMVYLEALSAGLPIIATKTFAVPEMVIEGKNGYLCESPINIFKKNFTPDPDWWKKDRAKYAKKHTFKNVEEFLKEKMTLLIKNYELIEKMGKNSKILYEKKFDEEKRKKHLIQALKK